MEAYYQYAARVAGATVQASLDATLRNSAVCKVIAGNSTARSTMSSKYLSSVDSYVKNNAYWNEGLNYLSYLLGKRAYLYHAGNQCTDVSGGWTVTGNGSFGTSVIEVYDNAQTKSSKNWRAYGQTKAYLNVTANYNNSDAYFGQATGSGAGASWYNTYVKQVYFATGTHGWKSLDLVANSSRIGMNTFYPFQFNYLYIE